MSRLGFFRRKKKEEKVEKKAKTEEKTLLERLCGDDSELYKVLSRTILVNPSLALQEGMNSYIQKAKELEEKGKPLTARVLYQAAGQIALYEGKAYQVQTFFKKCAETETNPEMKKIYEFYTKEKNLNKAVKVAKEYYERMSTLTEEKE